MVNTCRKVSQQIAVLKHMRNILPNDIRKNIYMPLIVPHFDCCAQTWHFCNNTSAEKLEKENERAVRFVFWDKHSTYKEFLKLLGRRTQMGQRMSKILCSVFKPVNNKRKPEWVNLITRKKNMPWEERTFCQSSTQPALTTNHGCIRCPRSETTCLLSWERCPILKRSKYCQKMSHYFNIEESPF